MKKLLALFLLLPLLFACSSDSDDNDDAVNPQGKTLAEIITNRIDYEFGEPAGDKLLVHRLRYNAKGLVVQERDVYVHYTGLTGVYDYTYKYDDNGNLIEILDESISGTLNKKSVLEYDSSNNLISKKEYRKRGLDRIYNYFYEAGKLITEEERDASLEIRYIYKYKYEGLTTYKDFYDAGETITLKYTYEHNEYGDLVKTTAISDRGEVIEKDDIITYKDDKIETRETGGDTVLKVIEKYFYDDDDKLIKVEFSDARTKQIKYIHILEYKYI